MAKTISVDQGTIITIANLIKMTVEEVKDGQVRLTFDAPEGVSHTTDLDGSIQIYIDSVSYTFTDGYRTSQHQSLGEVLGEIIDNLQLAPDRPISVVSNAAKSPREDA
ncbi:hypothetical protein BOW51_02555 [Solemya velesiana gill symbiont]|uniref:Uncharacterized protein n=2 Tax=Solemya velesiana gill symbiont TaxID=1918948 RepID=A0A1T2KX79_9GAMM|nr:hypothetical protein BOW51_02555 [Solemya velesiana gill symbiont]